MTPRGGLAAALAAGLLVASPAPAQTVLDMRDLLLAPDAMDDETLATVLRCAAERSCPEGVTPEEMRELGPITRQEALGQLAEGKTDGTDDTSEGLSFTAEEVEADAAVGTVADAIDRVDDSVVGPAEGGEPVPQSGIRDWETLDDPTTRVLLECAAGRRCPDGFSPEDMQLVGDIDADEAAALLERADAALRRSAARARDGTGPSEDEGRSDTDTANGEGLSFTEEEVARDQRMSLPIMILSCDPAVMDTDDLGTVGYDAGRSGSLVLPRLAVDEGTGRLVCSLAGSSDVILPAQVAPRSRMTPGRLDETLRDLRQATPAAFRRYVPTVAELMRSARFDVTTSAGEALAYTTAKQRGMLHILLLRRSPLCGRDPCSGGTLFFPTAVPWAPKATWPVSRDLAGEQGQSLDDEATRHALLCGSEVERFCTAGFSPADIQRLFDATREEIAASLMDRISEHPWTDEEDYAIAELWLLYRAQDFGVALGPGAPPVAQGMEQRIIQEGSEDSDEALQRLRDLVEDPRRDEVPIP